MKPNSPDIWYKKPIAYHKTHGMQNPLYPEIKGKFSAPRIDNIDVVDPKLKPIVDLIQIPYKFFGNICGNKNEILMDIASGEAHHKPIIYPLFKEIKFYDLFFQNTFIKKADVRDIPEEDNSVDTTFCFGTIDVLKYEDQLKALDELKRVTKRTLVVGNLDKNGLDYINGIMIYKNNTVNPFKVREMDSVTFPELLEEKFDDITYYQSSDNNGVLEMREGLSTRPKSYMNYALIRL